MKSIFVILICAACAACMPPRPLSFEKASASPQQLVEDQALCEFDARYGDLDGCMQMQKYEQCMTAKRYAAIPGSSERSRCGKTF